MLPVGSSGSSESFSCRSQRGRDIYMRTPLHTAILESDVEFIRALLNSGVERCDTLAMDNATPLHLACKGRNQATDAAIVQMILEQSTGRCTIDWQTKPKHKKSHAAYTPAVCGYTPLLYAIKAENPTIVKLLLDYGASLDLPGWIPINNTNNNTSNEDDDIDIDDAQPLLKVCPPLMAAKSRSVAIGSTQSMAVLKILEICQKEREGATIRSSTIYATEGHIMAEDDGSTKRRKVAEVKAGESSVALTQQKGSTVVPLDIAYTNTTAPSYQSKANSQYFDMLASMNDDPDGASARRASQNV